MTARITCFKMGERNRMMQITEQIKERRSVRTYDGRVLDEETKTKLMDFAGKIENPWGIPVEFRFLEAKRDGLACPVVTGADLYVGGKVKTVPGANAAFGYSFEAFVLYAQSLGLGTVWLGGTMNRGAFEKAMELESDEMMPCASPVGYPSAKMSMREIMMRKAVKADERQPFGELFFDGSFDVPLTEEKAGLFRMPLEMVRLAPSAVNKQPWRVVAADDTFHFYRKGKGSEGDSRLDMQRVDLGIALCHFALTAEELGLQLEFVQEKPALQPPFEAEYMGSYRLKP